MDVGSLNFMRVEQALTSHRPRCSCTEITACTEITVCAEFTACMEISHPRLSYVQIGTPAELYIRNIIPDDMGIPSPAVLALSGRGSGPLSIYRLSQTHSTNYVAERPPREGAGQLPAF